jgi:hypothetical protein
MSDLTCEHCEPYEFNGKPRHGDGCLFVNPNPEGWDRVDVEYDSIIQHNGHEYVVSVEKLGGGTLGHTYPGSWYIQVLERDAEGKFSLLMDDRLTSGMAHTHASVARTALDFLPQSEVGADS